jgi:hypothetical protein
MFAMTDRNAKPQRGQMPEAPRADDGSADPAGRAGGDGAPSRDAEENGPSSDARRPLFQTHDKVTSAGHDEEEMPGEEPVEQRGENEQHEQETQETQETFPPTAFINRNGQISFYPPSEATAESVSLVSDIVDLDHRSLRRLHKGSSDRDEVAGVLLNAANFTSYGDLEQGRTLFDRAQRIYSAMVESQNRVTYLQGVLLGLLPAAVLATALTITVSVLLPDVAPAHVLALVCFFAAIGSVTSVLTRLSTIDLDQEISRGLLLLSGVARPAVAVSFAAAIFMILESNLIDLRLGGTEKGLSDAAAVAIAFVVGFSERFAKDVITRISGD